MRHELGTGGSMRHAVVNKKTKKYNKIITIFIIMSGVAYLLYAAFSNFNNSVLQQYANNDSLKYLCMSKDGTYIIFNSTVATGEQRMNCKICICNQLTGEYKFINDPNACQGISISDDGRYIACGKCIYDWQRGIIKRNLYTGDRHTGCFSTQINGDANIVVWKTPNIKKNINDESTYRWFIGDSSRPNLRIIPIFPDSILANDYDTASISNDGNHAVLTNAQNIYLYDRKAEKYKFIARGSFPIISADGNMVVYSAIVKQELTESTVDVCEVFMYNIKLNKIIGISKTINGKYGGIQSGDTKLPGYFALDYTGHHIVYISTTNHIVAGDDAINNVHMYLYDSKKRSSRLIDIYGDTKDHFFAGRCGVAISSDGTYLTCIGNNLLPNEHRDTANIYVYNMKTGKLKCITTSDIPL